MIDDCKKFRHVIRLGYHMLRGLYLLNRFLDMTPWGLGNMAISVFSHCVYFCNVERSNQGGRETDEGR